MPATTASNRNLAAPAIRHQGPFEEARHQLIIALARLQPPRKLNVFPAPDEFIAVKDHLREVAAVLDEWLALIGHEIKDNAIVNVDARAFVTPFQDAVDGAMWQCERQADELLISSAEG